jgi:hypothetical protein
MTVNDGADKEISYFDYLLKPKRDTTFSVKALNRAKNYHTVY